MSISDTLRELADSIEAQPPYTRGLHAEIRQLKLDLERRNILIQRLRAREDLHQVRGLRKEVARLNALLNAAHERPEAAPTHSDGFREGYEAGRSGETGGHP